MKLSGIFGAVFIVFLFSCHKKEEKEPVLSDLLVEDFDCTKGAVFDTLNVSQHLRKIVKDISCLNVYETDQEGNGAIGTPANFKNFQKLYTKASEQDYFQRLQLIFS